MSTVRKTITVTDQQESWIKTQIAVGKFTNDSEYIRDLIRRDQSDKAEIEMIRAKLIASEQSVAEKGFSTRTPEQILSASKEELKRRGEL